MKKKRILDPKGKVYLIYQGGLLWHGPEVVAVADSLKAANAIKRDLAKHDDSYSYWVKPMVMVGLPRD